MPFSQKLLPALQVDGCRVPSPGEHRRTSSEFGWFDIEPLLTSTRTSRFKPWSEEDIPSESAHPGEESALPRALERVFEWLNEVEGQTNNARPKAKVNEAIIDARALLALRAPSSSVRRDGDKVIGSRAMTKADFCLASREHPPFAIGIYAHRMISRRRWLFWTECYAEYLVVVGTGSELLSAWRCYNDFLALASSVERVSNGSESAALKCWDNLERKRRDYRKIDPTRLRVEALYLTRFLANLVEELDMSDIEMLSEFAREPTTYVVVGVDNFESRTDVSNGADAVGGRSTSSGYRGDADTVMRGVCEEKLADQGCCFPSPGGSLGIDSSREWSKWQKRELVPLKPERRILEGL